MPIVNGTKRGDAATRRALVAASAGRTRAILKNLLGSVGVKADCVENGAKAVRTFCAAPDKYDIIFMDAQMPVMNGPDATELMRAVDLPKAKKIPVVAMVTDVFKEELEKCAAAGMNGYIRKRFDMDEIAGLLNIFFKGSDDTKTVVWAGLTPTETPPDENV